MQKPELKQRNTGIYQIALIIYFATTCGRAGINSNPVTIAEVFSQQQHLMKDLTINYV